MSDKYSSGSRYFQKGKSGFIVASSLLAVPSSLFGIGMHVDLDGTGPHVPHIVSNRITGTEANDDHHSGHSNLDFCRRYY